LPPTTIGVIGAAYFAGFLLAPWQAPRLIARAGHARTFAAAAALAVAAVLVMGLTTTPPAWIAARMAMGLAFATLYLIIESWLNGAVENRHRGKVLSAYVIVSKIGLIGGQLALNLTGLAGPRPFMVVAAVICAAIVLMALSAIDSPRVPAQARLRLRRLLRASPVGVVGCFAYGVCEGAFFALAAVFALQRGLSVAQITGFLAAFMIGGALLQWPAGLLSDRFDRRWVILAIAAGAALAALALTAARQPLEFLVGGLALGGLFVPLYALCVAHANDLMAPEDRVRTGGGLLLVYAIGAVLGPLAASVALTLTGPIALPVLIAAVCASLAAFTALQLARGPRRPPRSRDTPPAPPTSPALYDAPALRLPRADLRQLLRDRVARLRDAEAHAPNYTIV
jgi:MFS family permease